MPVSTKSTSEVYEIHFCKLCFSIFQERGVLTGFGARVSENEENAHWIQDYLDRRKIAAYGPILPTGKFADKERTNPIESL